MKVFDSIKLKVMRKRVQRRLTIRSDMEKIGSTYGGWKIPTDLMKKDSVCYCAGVGEDITFDLGIIDRFSCQVYAFDPTPRAKIHVTENASDNPNFHFYDIGIWSSPQKMKFYAPKNPSYVSHSITNIQNTDQFFEAECKSIRQLMKELTHNKLTLLKLDIEGAEYEVLKSVINAQLDIGIICVEFHNPIKRILDFIKLLEENGYNLVSCDTSFNCTFVNKKRA